MSTNVSYSTSSNSVISDLMLWAIFYLQTFISALIAGVSFFRYWERDTVVKLIGLFFLISCVCNCAQYLCLKLGVALVNQVATAYVFLTIIVGTWLYDLILGQRFRWRLLIISSIAFGWVLIVVFFIQNSGENTTYISLAAAFLWLMYSIVYFYRLMQDMPTIHLHRLPAFWFNSSFLIYSSGTIVLFASHDYLIRVQVSFWAFHNFVFILSQLIVLIGLYYDLKNANPKQTRAIR